MANLNLKTVGIKPLRKTPPNELLQYLPRWQSNNTTRDLGIVRFAFDLYELNRRMDMPPLYKDFVARYGVNPWASDCLLDYYTWEDGMTKEDRCFAIATHREGTKTFWFATLTCLYEATVGDYGIYFNNTIFPDLDYQVILTKNQTESKKRLMTISSLLNKKVITDIFGELKPTFQEVKRKDAKDEAGLLVLSNGKTFQASGFTQSTRGFVILTARPKKILFDDAENKFNTKTEEARKNNATVVSEDAMGALTDNGTMVYIGNKIHDDDTLGKLIDVENHAWHKYFYTLTVVKHKDGTISPGVGNLDKEVPLWDKRWTIEDIRKKMAWFISQPKLGGKTAWFKEYYNIIRSEADYKINYHKAYYLRAYGLNWLVFIKPDGNKEYLNVTINVGCDPAISEAKQSSDAAITAVAFDYLHRRYVLEISKGKYDINDRFYDDSRRPEYMAFKPEELANVRKKGATQESLRMAYKYHADALVVETNATNSTFFNEMADLVSRMGKYMRLYPIIANRNKFEKLKDNPLAYFENDLYFIREGMTDLEYEVLTFNPSSKKLDTLDSIHLTEQLAEFPKPVVYSPLGLIKAKDESYKKYGPQPKEPFESSFPNHLNDKEPWIYN